MDTIRHISKQLIVHRRVLTKVGKYLELRNRMLYIQTYEGKAKYK